MPCWWRGDVYDTILASKEAIELYDDIMYMLCMELKKKGDCNCR